MSAFSFAKGFAKRLGERQDAKDKAESALKVEQEKAKGADKLLVKKYDLIRANKEAELELQAKLDADEAEVKGFKGIELVDPTTKVAKTYNPWGKDGVTNTNKDFVYQAGLGEINSYTPEEKIALNEYIKANPDKKNVINFRKNSIAAVGVWLNKNKDTADDGTQVNKFAFNNTGLDIIDNYAIEQLTSGFYSTFQERKKNIQGNWSAWTTGGGKEFFVGQEIPQGIDEGSSFTVDPNVLAHREINARWNKFRNGNNTEGNPTTSNMVDKEFYKGLAFYNLANTQGFDSQDTSDAFGEFFNPRNDVNFTISDGSEDDYRDYEKEFLTDNPREDRWVNNPNIVMEFLDAYTLKDMDFDGKGIAFGPTAMDKKQLENLKTVQGFLTDFATFATSTNNMDSYIVDVRTAGGTMATPGTFADAFVKFVTETLPSAPGAETPLSQTAGDFFIKLLSPVIDQIDSQSIKSTFNDTFGDNTSLSISAIVKKGGGSEEANAERLDRIRSLGLDSNLKMSRSEFKQFEKDVKEIEGIKAKIATGTALDVKERRMATLISMAYTYASFIQGGGGGTRTVSDADVLFALRALGVSGGLNGEINSSKMSIAIRNFQDRTRELTKKGISSTLLINNERTITRPVEAKTLMDRMVKNISAENVANYSKVIGGNDYFRSNIRITDSFNRGNITSNSNESQEKAWQLYSSSEEEQENTELLFQDYISEDFSVNSSFGRGKIKELISYYMLLKGENSNASEKEKEIFRQKINQLDKRIR
jgi:hypothetical protein